MRDAFETLTRTLIAEDECAHPCAIERAVNGDELAAELSGDLRHRDAARRGDAMRDDVRVDERYAARGEQIGHRRFATADAAGQSHDEHASASQRQVERSAG